MRIVFRLLLGTSILIAFAVALASLSTQGLAEPSAWATVAAAFAVIAAVLSAWTSQRVLELQEDSLEPNPVPIIDLRSRYQLAQFRITNHGGGSAYDVTIIWQRQLRDAEGNDVLLGRDIAIPVLPKGESASVALGVDSSFLSAHPDTTCSGKLEYANATGQRFIKSFVVSAEHERKALRHDEEALKTLRELQNIPAELQSVAREIAKLAGILKRRIEP